MSTPARRRLMRDFKRLQKDPPLGISGAPCPDNIMKWNAVIFGPCMYYYYSPINTTTNMCVIYLNINYNYS